MANYSCKNLSFLLYDLGLPLLDTTPPLRTNDGQTTTMLRRLRQSCNL